MARTGPAAMSAVRSLSGVIRTWLERPISVEIDPTRPNILLSTGPDVFQVSRLASYTASVEPADAETRIRFPTVANV
jgi:hypothetical protein